MVNVLVNMRFSRDLLKEIDSVVRDGLYSTRTEFIKEAVRRELSDYRKRQLIASLRKKLGEGKRLGIKDLTPEEFEKIREEVGRELFKKHGLG